MLQFKLHLELLGVWFRPRPQAPRQENVGPSQMKLAFTWRVEMQPLSCLERTSCRSLPMPFTLFRQMASLQERTTQATPRGAAPDSRGQPQPSRHPTCPSPATQTTPKQVDNGTERALKRLKRS